MPPPPNLGQLKTRSLRLKVHWFPHPLQPCLMPSPLCQELPRWRMLCSHHDWCLHLCAKSFLLDWCFAFEPRASARGWKKCYAAQSMMFHMGAHQWSACWLPRWPTASSPAVVCWTCHCGKQHFDYWASVLLLLFKCLDNILVQSTSKLILPWPPTL